LRATLLATALACGACLSPPASAGDGGATDDRLRRKLVTLHPPQVGPVSPQPVAIILEQDDDLAAAAREDGADIRVGDGPGGSELAHEIELWDPATGALVVWVLVPIVAEGTVLELRYGDGIERPQLPGEVWLGYGGVWHLDDDPARPPPQMTDSTPGAHAGSVMGTTPASVPGVAGPALAFDGGGLIAIPDHVDLDHNGSFSYEAWVYLPSLDGVGVYDNAWHKGGSSTAHVGYDLELGTGEWNAALNDGTTSIKSEFSEEPIIGAWAHLVAVVDRQNDELRTYLDGSQVAFEPIDDLAELVTEIDAAIGGSTVSATGMVGTVDEVRVRDGTITALEIAIQHANLRAPGDFLEIGDEQPAP
jgi:hypothetical protein